MEFFSSLTDEESDNLIVFFKWELESENEKKKTWKFVTAEAVEDH